MQRVYLETSVISYLASRPSRDLIVAAHQRISLDWWERRRHDYDLFLSELVLREAGAGDPEAAKRRLLLVSGIGIVAVTGEVAFLARRFLGPGLIPRQAVDDAVHVAIATVHGMDFLLTWNCRHIANAAITRDLRSVAADHGFDLPAICTPEELLGESYV